MIVGGASRTLPDEGDGWRNQWESDALRSDSYILSLNPDKEVPPVRHGG